MNYKAKCVVGNNNEMVINILLTAVIIQKRNIVIAGIIQIVISSRVYYAYHIARHYFFKNHMTFFL